MKYYVLEHQGPEDAYELKGQRRDRFSIAEIAKDYHGNRDGWESIWPLTFVILSDDGHEQIRYVVEREYEPTFYAMEIPIKELSHD